MDAREKIVLSWRVDFKPTVFKVQRGDFNVDESTILALISVFKL
jgi:hypothetical protein